MHAVLCSNPGWLHAGKFLGVLDRIAHIRAVGATAVMLSPPVLSGAGDGPFGRAPFSFYAPELAWTTGPDALAPVRELKELVKGLHAKNIEVWLQVSALFYIALQYRCVYILHIPPPARNGPIYIYRCVYVLHPASISHMLPEQPCKHVKHAMVFECNKLAPC